LRLGVLFGVLVFGRHNSPIEQNKLMCKGAMSIGSKPTPATVFYKSLTKRKVSVLKWTPSLGQDRGYVKSGSRCPHGIRC